MFFVFTERFEHCAVSLAAIWETEIAIAAVLIGAIDAEQEINATGLIAEANELLASRSLPVEILNESRRDLEFLTQSNSDSVRLLMFRLADWAQRPALQSELHPVRDRIVAACDKDDAFAAYLRRQRTATDK